MSARLSLSLGLIALTGVLGRTRGAYPVDLLLVGIELLHHRLGLVPETQAGGLKTPDFRPRNIRHIDVQYRVFRQRLFQ